MLQLFVDTLLKSMSSLNQMAEIVHAIPEHVYDLAMETQVVMTH